MPGRKYSIANTNYRYGFNGQEKSNEINSHDNLYSAEFWEYDSRIGRRWNLDSKPSTGISEYSAFKGNPIWFSDPLGDTSGIGTRIWGGVKAIGGVIEMGIGAAGGAATSWTGIGAIAGGAAVVHGADVTAAGLNQALTGEEAQTFTQQAISKGLQTVGVSTGKAEMTANFADASLSLILSAGAGIAKDGTFVAKRPLLGKIKAETKVSQVAKEGVSAYETALTGGRHSGFLKNYLGTSSSSIRSGISKMEANVIEHQNLISNPSKYMQQLEKGDWNLLDPRQQQHLLNVKWPGDIQRSQEQINILQGILKSR